MCSSTGRIASIVLLLAGSMASGSVVADAAPDSPHGPHSPDRSSGPGASGAPDAPVRLEATPATCVALHRGQTCYVRVALSWSRLGPGRWCLRRGTAVELLTCWRDDTIRAWSHRYASADRETYLLVADPANTKGASGIATSAHRATATVSTAWVYRGRRRGSTGWRLF